MLRLGILSAASALAITVSANAADLYRAPIGGGLKDGPYVPAATWTGFYIGGNGGYAWGDDSHVTSDVTVTLPARLDPPFSSSGAFGGGQIGYNWQGIHHPNIVLGLEVDIQGADINGSGTATATQLGGSSVVKADSSLDWFGSVRGRLGYSFGDVLVYGTGGFAFGGVKDTLSVTAKLGANSANSTVSDDSTATGYTVGGGFEYALSRTFSLKAEYQYIDLDGAALSTSKQLVVQGQGTTTVDASGKAAFDHSYNTVRVGLNYHIVPGYEPLK
jgi:outer membrane immunogenic protein